MTGYDLGLSHDLIDNNGVKVLSRKKLGSTSRRKARVWLAVQHERVASARADFQHKLSGRIIDENQAVIVETLKSVDMKKNCHLARHIGDAAYLDLWQNSHTKWSRQGSLGQTGSVVCQLENLPLLRSQNARNAAQSTRIDMPRL
ncbi:transposase [Salmonella enterica subsp. enterica]|nr:transposase [Salmonella enterica subsp. enterica serovar Bonn]EBZ5939349.1 transposase [Salmonella enterica subsp. enterica serovar Muenchen]MLZ41092.1 transposase [Salmonella enterica subsp. enterica serovar Bonn]